MSVKLLALLLVALSANALSARAEQGADGGAVFISGVQPDRRPADAPVITEFNRDPGWYRQALKGITPPYSNSLRFLDDQGAWYTPFNRPNASGRYDIRGLYPATNY